MATTSSNKIMAWLNVSKSTLKAGQTEQLTIEFIEDPGALSVQDFTATGGVLSHLEGSGLERTLVFTAGTIPGPADVTVQSDGRGDTFQMIPSGPLTILSAPHSISVQQVDVPAPQPVAQNFQPTAVAGMYKALPTLSGHADPGSTVKVLIQSSGNLVASPNDMSNLGLGNIRATVDVVADPLGGRTADKLVSTLASGSNFVETYLNANIVKDQAYTLSAYVKADGSNFAQIIGNAGTFGSFNVNFDLSRGIVVAQGSGTILTSNINIADCQIDSVGSGWYRVSVTATAIGSNASNHMSLGMVKSSTSARGDGALAANSGLDVWGFSFAQGGFVIDGIAGSHAGATAFGAGDLNGDGFADLVIGDTAGHQYVVYGGPQFITQTFVNGKTLINGTSGDDTLTGTDSAEAIVGGTGNDVIDGKGGADVLLGGDGNDAFIFGAAMARSNTFLKVDGGAGYDKIELHDGVTFDLSAIMNLGADRVANIEKIDMTTDALHNEVSLSSASILAAGGQMTLGSTTLAHGLTIDGASIDTLHLTSADGWRVDTIAHDPAYDLYVASNGAHLMVSHQVQFDLH